MSLLGVNFILDASSATGIGCVVRGWLQEAVLAPTSLKKFLTLIIDIIIQLQE